MQKFPDWLHSRAATVPERVALAAEGRQWTFRQLDAEADRAARRLAALGVKEGDRVATIIKNGFAAAVLPHATLRLGATLVPLNTRLTTKELDWQIDDIEPRIVIRDQGTLEQSEEKDVELRRSHPSDAVLAVIYTSGTTGHPKGAMLTVGNFWWSAIGSALNIGAYPRDRWLASLPLFHVGGLAILIRSAIYGITTVIHDGFDADAVNAAIEKSEVSIVSVVAVMLERMLDARPARPYPPSLRCVLVGGGPVPRPLLERCASLLIPVVQTYGMTETCSQVATIAPEDAIRKLGSCGKVLYPNELRISDDGEILVRGPVVMAGYAKRPAETSSAIIDGWLRTGDAGSIDADGFLFVLDRRDDLMITGGENVYPAEVEAVLSSHPSVAEAGVIGTRDITWGQRVVAVVKLKESMQPDAEALSAHCAAQLASFKVPREFRFTRDPLPRTAAGKLRRSALRELYDT
jgi:o-succinylbenzoate---CoA ligase